MGFLKDLGYSDFSPNPRDNPYKRARKIYTFEETALDDDWGLLVEDVTRPCDLHKSQLEDIIDGVLGSLNELEFRRGKPYVKRKLIFDLVNRRDITEVHQLVSGGMAQSTAERLMRVLRLVRLFVWKEKHLTKSERTRILVQEAKLSGLTQKQASESLELSLSTVKRNWK